MGDSIKQARAFMRCCETALTDLTEASAGEAIEALVSIQSGAKLNHARAIYRAAQEAIEHVSTASLEDRVATLSHLITQYETGLEELEVEADTSDAPETSSAPIDEAIETNPIEPEVIAIDFSEDARRQRALTALSDSLVLAKDTERKPLSRLINFANDETPSHVLPTQDAIIDDKSVVPLQLTPEKATPLKKKTMNVTLESFIGDVVQQGLTFARQSNLTLSLSYDMGTIALPESKSIKIKRRMGQWLGQLVHHMASNSEKGALAHIDMNATAAAVTFSATAPALSEDILKRATDTSYIRQEFDPVTSLLRLHLSLTEGAPLLKAPKLPVEEGIGARLDALLADTQSANDGLALDNSNLLAFKPVGMKRASS